MTENKRAREFWIRTFNDEPYQVDVNEPRYNNEYYFGKDSDKKFVHVIEFSEVARLEKEVAEWKDRHEIVSSTNKLQRMTIGELNRQRDSLKAENESLRKALESMHIDDCGWDIPNLDVTVARAWHLSNNEKIKEALAKCAKGEKV